MHSVRLEPTKLIWIGTRTTYQATGDAGIGTLATGIPFSIRTRYVSVECFNLMVFSASTSILVLPASTCSPI